MSDEEAVAVITDLVTKANVDLDPRKVLLGCKSHHGDAWPSKLKGWTLGAIARAAEKSKPIQVVYDGPAVLREDVARHKGEGYAVSYIDTARWRDEDRTLLMRLASMASRLVEDMGRQWVIDREISVGVMAANDASASAKHRGRVGWV